MQEQDSRVVPVSARHGGKFAACDIEAFAACWFGFHSWFSFRQLNQGVRSGRGKRGKCTFWRGSRPIVCAFRSISCLILWRYRSFADEDLPER
ncbi:hypothetical protein ABIC94_004799 [Variovorax paradoxus]|uniref:hypothetical protein n=1 Tax=Variovorax paradoxus TaxID=34073 RepID=UPI00339B1A0D